MSAGKNGAKKREGQGTGLGAVDASPTVQTQQPAAPKVISPLSAHAGPHKSFATPFPLFPTFPPQILTLQPGQKAKERRSILYACGRPS